MTDAVVIRDADAVIITPGQQQIPVFVSGAQGSPGANAALGSDLASDSGSALVTWLPATGAQAMNLQTALRLGLPVMPEHYGAVGDGVADDTAAVQAAIDSGAERIYLKNSYAVTGITLNQLSNIHIFGLGTLLMTGAPVNGTHALAIIQCDRITVEGITINGQNETRGALAGAQNLSIYGSTNCELRNVKSIYSSSDGLYLNRAATSATVNGVAMGNAVSKNIRVVGCLFDYACRQGMSGIAFEGAVLESCSFSNVGQSTAGALAPAAGIDLEANDTVSHFPLRTVIRGCRFYNNSGAGIIVNGRASETTIEGCHVEGGTSYGISNAGSRTVVRNTLIKTTGAVSRPSINNGSQTGYERASLTVENCWIVGAIQGGITHTSYADLIVRNCRVSDGANYGLRLTPGADPGDGDKGFVLVERLIVERLFENTPPSSIHYVTANTFDGNLILRKVRLVRTGATGTPIERGITVANATDVQEITDLNVIGAFSSVTTTGLNLPKILRNNRLDGVVTAALNMTGSAVYDPPSIAAAGTATTTVTVTGAALGEKYNASFSLSLAGLVLSAYVSAANTVTCVFFNPTAGAVDLASGTLNVSRVGSL